MAALIYLDTHAVVWLFAGELELFPERALAAIEKSDLQISPMVVLELHYLAEMEKIHASADRIIHELALSIGLSVCKKGFADVIAQAGTFTWTRDPFDRIITAQAMAGQAHLVTKDATIRAHYRRAIWD